MKKLCCIYIVALLFISNSRAQDTVKIGNQTWMSNNLDVSTYSDSTPIPKVTDAVAWAELTTGAYCYYKNDSAKYAATYGKLYNWYAVTGIYDAASLANPALRKKLALAGWHIPSDREWTTLSNALDGVVVAGGKMKDTTHWKAPNIGATNSSGFTCLPGGSCNTNGKFYDVGNNGSWWSASESVTEGGWARSLYYFNGSISRYNISKSFGFSVRCVRD